MANKITFNYSINNMFIWNSINNIISTKKLLSKFANNLNKLRILYNNYIKEIQLVCPLKLFNKLFTDMIHIIHRTESIVNYLYYHKWDIKNMSNDVLLNFVSIISVYTKNDTILLNNNLDKINKIKTINTTNITKITNKIIKEFEKLKIKSDKLF